MTFHARSTDMTRILGAGPAGLTAAITLARAGRPVVVYERAPDVGTRHDGDFEAIENWTTRADLCDELAGWGLQTNFRCVPIHTLTCFGPGFRAAAHVEDAQPLFYVVLRGPQEDSLDHGLLAQARAAGVQVEFRRTARLDEVDIVATGFPRARTFVAGYSFTTRAPNGCSMCLDWELTPTLYSYLITCEGRGTIGFGGAAPQSDMKRILDRVVAGFRSRVRFDMHDPQYFVAAGTFGLPQTAQRDGRLYVGEAAELQDPLFGFGLRISMTTGYLAVRSILDGRDYDALWQDRLAPQLRAAAVHRMLFQMIGNTGYRLLMPYVRLFAHAGRDLCHRYYRPMWYTPLLWPLAVLTTIFGPLLFFLPGRTDVTWAWQIRPDMSVIVVGAGYIFGACAITTLLIRNQWHALNTAIFATWLFSTAMLVATLLHLDRFFVGTLRFNVWFVIYLALPIALPIAWWFNRPYSKPRSPDDLVFEPPLRYANMALGVVLLAFGLFMFFNPPGAAAIWPWQLTPLMSQVIGGWIMFLGAGGVIIYFEPRYSAYRALIPATLVWDIALLLGSFPHLDNFDFSRTSPWVWFIVLIAFTLGNIAALAIYEPQYRRRTQGPAAALAS